MTENNIDETRKCFYSPASLCAAPALLFCEQHGWTGVTEGVCYGAPSCKDAAVCVLAANFTAMREKKVDFCSPCYRPEDADAPTL